MPGSLVHVGSTILCPHAGQVSVVTTNTRVFVSGQPVATLADIYPIAGCNSAVCVIAIWIVPATRVFVNGQPVILKNSVGVCQSAIQSPQGPPNVIVTQSRVDGV